MTSKLFAAAAVAAFALVLPARADAACCEAKQAPACCQAKPDHACCDAMKGHVHEASAIDILLANDPQLVPAPPVRQVTEVWFTRPTLIGRAIVQGRYVIEHDNDRMARGEPCTHIYAYNDQANPVATFHCTHLERDRATKNTVVLVTLPDGMQKLTEFQFAGETAAHGYPTDR
ncbi:MAG TPA: hypothetical protein VNT81_16940 [Vicinamibacterales bacterium]|nr:hypothetical protein [Vicinamibacterales bacterium]